MAFSEVISKVFSPFIWLFSMIIAIIRKIFSYTLSITLIVLLIVFSNDIRIISHDILNNIVKSHYVQAALKKIEELRGNDKKQKAQ
ncbi:MAG: hypothetical protein ACK5WS_05045 [Alphaproteobacteria bacterium]|jgi:hypothetical protein|nr:hypothetical protein [Candidatus Jidaibacter sp.]